MRVPPRAARPPAGVVDYPRWGEIYYLSGERLEQQPKRWLVLSDDRWNQQKRTVLAVRLTKQLKHPSDEFPVVADESRACCGDMAGLGATRLDLRHRPIEGPSRVNLAGMAAVVRGVAHTHVLRDDLSRAELHVATTWGH